MYACASKFKIAQNHFLNNLEYEPGHFKHFKIFCTCAPTSACARAEDRNAVFSHGSELWHILKLIHKFSVQSNLKWRHTDALNIKNHARVKLPKRWKWAKTCYFWNRNSSSEWSTTPNFYVMVGKSMSWRYDSIPPWTLQSETKSAYRPLNSELWFLFGYKKN